MHAAATTPSGRRQLATPAGPGTPGCADVASHEAASIILQAAPRALATPGWPPPSSPLRLGAIPDPPVQGGPGQTCHVGPGGRQGVEGHGPCAARARVLEGLARPIPEQLVVVHARDRQQPEAPAQPRALRDLGLRGAAAEPALEGRRGAVGDRLEGPQEARAAGVEVGGLGRGLRGHAPAELCGQEDSVGVRLHGPVVEPEAAQGQHPAPGEDKDLGAEGRPALAARVQGRFDHLGHDLFLGAHSQHDALVADDGMTVACEDPNTGLELGRD
mmetsp:Transcript_2133/g.6478  ORF Transcript_2133/g.6478 Transcript_2133/m.6478 type:complete len:273 (+) Transcript_2133:321-1139(+)